jgi:hypothetical protein
MLSVSPFTCTRHSCLPLVNPRLVRMLDFVLVMLNAVPSALSSPAFGTERSHTSGPAAAAAVAAAAVSAAFASAAFFFAAAAPASCFHR